jgi:hypothetical protein
MSRNTSFMSATKLVSAFAGSLGNASRRRVRDEAQVQVVHAQVPLGREVDALVDRTDPQPVRDVVAAVLTLRQAEEVLLLQPLHAVEDVGVAEVVLRLLERQDVPVEVLDDRLRVLACDVAQAPERPRVLLAELEELLAARDLPVVDLDLVREELADPRLPRVRHRVTPSCKELVSVRGCSRIHTAGTTVRRQPGGHP